MKVKVRGRVISSRLVCFKMGFVTGSLELFRKWEGLLVKIFFLNFLEFKVKGEKRGCLKIYKRLNMF